MEWNGCVVQNLIHTFRFEYNSSLELSFHIGKCAEAVSVARDAVSSV